MTPKSSHLTTLGMTLTLPLLAMQAQADVSVLVYHHVSSETPPSTSTSPDLFEEQLDKIEELDMEVVALDHDSTADALEGHDDDQLRVALTFDDAYESVYTTAWPMLKERDIPFTIFVMTDAIDDGTSGYMTWEQIKELADHELVTIANHSVDHGALIQRPDESEDEFQERIEYNLDKANERIEEKTGVESDLFAHPYGEFSEPLSDALSERDWYGFAQHSGILGKHTDPYNIPRFPVADAFGGIDTLEDKLKARNFPVPYDELPSPILGDENPPKLTMTLPEDWDVGRLNCFAPRQGAMEKETSSEGDKTKVTVQADDKIEQRRARYNCTYPAGDGRFYWLSQPWFNKEADEG